MSLDKQFNFTEAEPTIWEKWRQSGAFAPNMAAKEAFSIMMPPPNVTGTLHLGHALDNTLPDILVRRARMQGKAALYQPGTDHASIAVHVVLERQYNEQGKTRFDDGREKFLERAWAWKEQSAGTIKNQMRRLGISADWENERFTMDDDYAKAIENVFITLYERGLIYRGQRLVNWDPRLQTTVSDMEVGHKEVAGHLWHFEYPFAEKSFTYGGLKGIHIATTRPETILADGAIAINPNDPRAKDLVGKFVTVPIVNRDIPIIADDYVDPEFGSGMVKITAAHDFNDYEVYLRHKDAVNIPLINLMHPNGTMNENCPEAYQGLDRFDARQKVIADFKALGLFIKAEEHTHQVPMAERDDTILEPYLVAQWFVKGKPLAEKCLARMDAGEIHFVNTRDEKILRHWFNNAQDWCISRQLWWGHRIPAWFKADSTYVVQAEKPEGEGWKQDEDILDTWFSSALWPFATQGWQQVGDETNSEHPHADRMAKFFPSSLINNGRDIIPFWDMRMMMMSIELTGQVPWKTVYTHGLIQDENGQKMSKSKGNILDPMDLVDEFGADAVRLTMASIASSEDMRFSKSKVEQSRNFLTKLWNAAKFLEMNGVKLIDDQPSPEHAVNQWLLGEFGAFQQELAKNLEAYKFNLAAQSVVAFTRGTFCDWFVELMKPLVQEGTGETPLPTPFKAETLATAGFVFQQLLKELHAFVPFVTEGIWQAFGNEQPLIAAQLQVVSANAQPQVQQLIHTVQAIRTLRDNYRVPQGATVQLATDESSAWLADYAMFLKRLCRTELGGDMAASKAGIVIADGFKARLCLENVIDLEAEKLRLQKALEAEQAIIASIEGRLNNQAFVAKAPEAVIAKNHADLAAAQAKKAELMGLVG